MREPSSSLLYNHIIVLGISNFNKSFTIIQEARETRVTRSLPRFSTPQSMLSVTVRGRPGCALGCKIEAVVL